jgi:succinate-semialdehyde dehydrogenase/glutarate-semialdehyde dehydrogenase
MKSINPSTELLIREYEPYTIEQCNRIIDQVYETWNHWKTTTMDHRSQLMMRVAEVLEKRRDELALLMTKEMGKPLRESRSEIEKCAWVCRYYAENAAQILADETIASDATRSFVSFESLGVVLAVMPWNFPFWQVFRFAAPALMAGNAGVLKHASNVSGCAVAIESVFEQAGAPENLFRTLLVGSDKVDEILHHRHIRAATLTGSEHAGSKVAATCGRLLKKTVLELGGSDAFIVLADADIEKCVETAVTARMINAGQSCIAAKRFIVAKEVYDDFVARAIRKMESLKTGDPATDDIDYGPLARADLMEALQEQIGKSVSMGAKLRMGGHPLKRKGFYFAPALVTDVTAGMPLFDEETFGPVMAVIKAESEEHAIQHANNSQYGLGGSLWSRDTQKAQQLARQIESGGVFINGMTKSDPRLPFGGIKNSGYGRELSHYGIKEFVNIKTIWVKE